MNNKDIKHGEGSNVHILKFTWSIFLKSEKDLTDVLTEFFALAFSYSAFQNDLSILAGTILPWSL